ncbi:MAG: hypothetical protein NVS3B5_19930 [Sphingomicrobium sp.]
MTYAGKLLSSKLEDTENLKKHKHHLRSCFHPQMKKLYETTPHLVAGKGMGDHVIWERGLKGMKRYDASSVAAQMYNHWRFVSLVTEELKLSCWIDILYLRRYPPGSLINRGDLDNRLKTLFDALAIPNPHQGYENLTPEFGETPFFYCLLENDKFISKITIETDTMLQEVQEPPDDNDARLVITVRVRPYEMTFLNAQFG